MPLIKDDRIIEDPWVTLGDDEPVPHGARAIVSPERWREERDALAARAGGLGVRLRSDQPPGLIAEDLHRLTLVALEFPKFTDGRAYSYARLLRERHGFAGELRAVGNVLRDQAIFMRRCGFDAFEVGEETTLEAWRAALGRISVWYQPAADGRLPVFALRHAGRRSVAPAGGASAARAAAAGKRSNGSTSATAVAGHRAPPAATPRLANAEAEPCTAHWAY